MKQFDTVQNNEWIPTEADLEGAIRVVDALPTASAEVLNITYLLNGTMEGYTRTHFYKCTKETIDGVEQYVWRDLNVGKYSVGNCTNIRLMMFDDGASYRVIISWKDPEDVVVGSDHVYWKETRLVHQIGHMPIDVNDCVDSFTSTVRDQYSSFGSYSFSFASDSRKHYFKLFPVSTDGAITNDDSNGRVAGYNFVLTADNVPQYDYDNSAPIKDYYTRTINASTGNYTYTKCSYDSDNFDGSGTSADPYTFKAGKIYYEYQNAFITWAGIQDLIRNGEAPNYFNVSTGKAGSILTLPYHGDFGEMSYEVVDYDGVQPADAGVGHTMTLQSKYLYRWWDYSGGVVFDTNEKGGAYTEDQARNADKTYFGRVTFGAGYPVSEVLYPQSTAFTATAATAVGNVESGKAIYVETIHDESRRKFQYGESDIKGWTADELFECELPYVTRFFDDTLRWWNSSTYGNTNRAFYGKVPIPSDVPAVKPNDSNYYWDPTVNNASNVPTNLVKTSDVTFKYGKQYWKRSGTGVPVELYRTTTWTSRGPATFFDGEVISSWIAECASGNSVYESASNAVKFGTVEQDRNATAAYAATTPSAMWDFVNAEIAWGGNYSCLSPNFASPRANGYAEYFTPVVPAGGSELNGATSVSYSSLYKYYVPTEKIIAKYKIGTSSSKATEKMVYHAKYKWYMRDISLDLYAINKFLTECPAASRSAYTRYAHEKTAGDFTTRGTGSSWRMNVEEVLASWIPMPCCDDRYQAKKRYFRVSYSEASGTSIVGAIYYRRLGTGSKIDPYVFVRIRCEGGITLSSLGVGTVYLGQFTEMVEGTDYNVGDLIPTQYAIGGKYYGYAMPYLVLKRKAIASATEMAEDDTFGTSTNSLYFVSDNGKITYTSLNSSSGNTETTYLAGSTVETWRNAKGISSTKKVYKVDNAYIWTNGDIGADGEYVTCGTDYRNVTPSATSMNTYSPSWPNITTAWTDAGYATASSTLYGTYLTGGNRMPLVRQVFEAVNNSYLKPVLYAAQGSTSVTVAAGTALCMRFGTTYQNFTVGATGATSSISFTSAGTSGTFAENTIYFTKSDDVYTAVTVTAGEAWSGTEYYTCTIVWKGGTSAVQWFEACASTLKNVQGLDIRRQTGINIGTIFYYATPTKLLRLCYKTPNTERVAYGNHVWAQSNIRYYFNGPFDASAEYIRTYDASFKVSENYYTFTSGKYVRLTAAASGASPTKYVPGGSVAQWEADTHLKVYTKFTGGIPVGYKLDINRPDKYNEYGLSPVQQYKFNSTKNQWVGVYSDGSCWWSNSAWTDNKGPHVNGEPKGQPSINNGLIYDRLATMFWSNCILAGEVESASHSFKFSPATARTTSGTEGGVTYGGIVDKTMRIRDNGSWRDAIGTDYKTGAASYIKFRNILPRQSFLHGFLDCKYKRTSDTTAQTGKDYYLKNPYGEYEKLDPNDTEVTGGPYTHTLYELNDSYHDDLANAKEFLDAIVPVVNRNGCYGTRDAWDFYSREGASAITVTSGVVSAATMIGTALGGTTTIDKVWLASTAQVSTANRGSNNGVYENPQNGASTTNASFTLTRWQGVADSERIKKGLTLGAHGTSGYADAMAGAQYWWLRSAGGAYVCYRGVWLSHLLNYDNGIPCSLKWEYVWGLTNLTTDTNHGGLSPLITLG